VCSGSVLICREAHPYKENCHHEDETCGCGCGYAGACSALPAFGAGNKTYKTTYSVPCSELWGAVKVALGNPDNYKDVQSDEDKMIADYNVKHSIHWSVIGAVNQGKNHVSLVPIGTTCEMSVVSMYSGLSHNDQGDFKKRVDEALAKLQAPKPAEPTKPETPAK
jgi:hypothetical protein